MHQLLFVFDKRKRGGSVSNGRIYEPWNSTKLCTSLLWQSFVRPFHFLFKGDGCWFSPSRLWGRNAHIAQSSKTSLFWSAGANCHWNSEVLLLLIGCCKGEISMRDGRYPPRQGGGRGGGSHHWISGCRHLPVIQRLCEWKLKIIFISFISRLFGL